MRTGPRRPIAVAYGEARPLSPLRTVHQCLHRGKILPLVGRVAQLDRALRYERRGWEFESLRAHQSQALMLAVKANDNDEF